MWKILFKKEYKLQSLIYKYLELLIMAKENFYKALHTFHCNPGAEEFEFYLEETHKNESRADDVRDEIKDMMYRQALIPESREDLLVLIDSLDEIPGFMEDVLYTIRIQKLCLPELIKDDFYEFVNYTLECISLVIRQVEALFRKTEDIGKLAKMIDQNESHCDHIGRRILTVIFASQLDPFVKLQLKDLILRVGSISDQADRVSRKICILEIKRRV